jgi:RNA recognition motif-containing protein
VTDTRKLFVGNLSWNTDEGTLRRAFEGYGNVVSVRVITDRETGRSRGFGFVTFSDAQGAQQALSLDGINLDGRTIRVREAENKAPPLRNEQRSRDW